MSNPKSPKATYTSLETDETPKAEAVAVASVGMPNIEAKQTVEVVAPADLSGGYQFSVDVNGRAMVVAVPEGGVKKGQRFYAHVLHQDEEMGKVTGGGHGIPVGAWRDGICDCCVHGCCHPVCCLSYWCQPLALGQLMTRMGLDFCATPSTRRYGMSPFKFMLLTLIAYICIDQALSLLVMQYFTTEVNYDQNGNPVYQQNGGEPIPGWANFVMALRYVIQFCYGIYILIVAIKTRAYIRNKYAIPEQYCSGCDDCCLVFWCGCCSTSQMLRHTADYRTYNAACCTETGLPATAPAVV